MSKASEAYLRGIPTKPYDLLREGGIVFGIVAVVVVILAIIFSSPDYPTLTIQEVAKKKPVSYLKLVTAYLSGTSDLQTYGPPYTNNPENAQALFGFFSPQRWVGRIIPVNPQKQFAMEPLKRLSQIDPTVATALHRYEAASKSRQAAWDKNFTNALGKAKVTGDIISIPRGDYGPVEAMMNGLLNLARAGLMTGALQNGKEEPYNLNNTNTLLFLQAGFPDSGVESQVGAHLDMLGNDWGISHEAGNYPGAWWLWPYTFLYQVPPMATSPNGDLQVVAIVLVALVLLPLFAPFVPVVNRIPRWIPIYRIIWRRWYERPGP